MTSGWKESHEQKKSVNNIYDLPITFDNIFST